MNQIFALAVVVVVLGSDSGVVVFVFAIIGSVVVAFAHALVFVKDDDRQ